MKISDILKNTGLTSLRSNTNEESAAEKANKNELKQNNGEDQISISPAARQMQRIQAILADDEQTRQLKIADIKQKLESGEFKIDSQAVAASLVDFARESQFS